MITRYSHCYAFIVGAGCLGLLINIVAYGAPPHKSVVPGKSTSQPASLEDQIRRQQSAAWTAFYTGKYEDAIKLADPLLKAPKDWARVEAAHCQARCFWSAGTKASMAKAQQLWTAMDKAATLNAHQERMTLAKSLGLEAKGQDAQAVELLEGIVKKKLTDTCTAEAAIELARLYVKTKKFDEAKETLNFAVAFLQKEAKVELSPIASEPFIKVAAAAIAHLPYDQDPGREQFEKADALREAKKYMDAMKAYQAVMKDFAKTDYAPRSEMSIGYCWQGLKQPAQAVEHWKKFIAAGSSSSWRGQAFTALLDLCLEETLDLTEANKWAELAGVSIEAGLNNETSEPSWKKCVLDIHLRCGLVAFLMEKNRAAVEAFEEAKKVARLTTGSSVDESTGIVGGLDRLIAAAKANKPVTPDEVHDPKADKKVALLCAMGTIYNCTEQYKRAASTFGRVVTMEFTTKGKAKIGEPPKVDAPPALIAKTSKGPLGQNASPAQFSYAIFGLGAALRGQAQFPHAKECFLADLKTFVDATWRDETLYCLATTIQDQAEAKFGKSSVGGILGKPVLHPAQPLTQQERQAQDKADKERLVSLVNAKREALPYWQEIGKKYPKSLHCEYAAYAAGVLLCEEAEVASTSKSEQVWKDAALSLDCFCEAYPKSLWAGDARIRHIDIVLERMFVLPKAHELAKAGQNWITDHEKKPVVTSQPKVILSLWQTASPGPDAAAIKFFVYDLRLRGIMTAYLSEEYDEAGKRLAANGPLDVSNGPADAEKLQKVGLYFLQKAIVAKKPVWKPEVIQAAKTEQQRTAVKLADFYLKAIRPEKAIAIYERILNKDPAFAPTVPTLQVYACIQLARCYAYDRDKHDKALEVLQTLYRTDLAKEPLIAEGLVWLGTLTYNFTQDPQKSMPHFQYVLKHFPDSPWAERALYFYCLDAVAAKDKAVAESACKEFLARYPRSAWAKHITSILKDQVAKLPSRERNGQ